MRKFRVIKKLSLHNKEVTSLPSPDDIDDYFSKRELAEVIEGLLMTLPPREAQILILRLGLGGCEEHTFKAIGQIYGFSRSRAQQLYLKALRRMKHPYRVCALAAWYNYPRGRRYDGPVFTLNDIKKEETAQ